jgi:hypothetical protein
MVPAVNCWTMSESDGRILANQALPQAVPF